MDQLCHCPGDTVNGIPIVCSGKVNVPTDSCYLYLNGKWLKSQQTISSRVFKASSVSLSNSLFVTGGTTLNDNAKYFVNTTNLVFTNGTVKNGPNMPQRLAWHCMAKMYDGKVAAIIGGK